MSLGKSQITVVRKVATDNNVCISYVVKTPSMLVIDLLDNW